MEAYNVWEFKRKELWDEISVLTPQAFESGIWTNVEALMKQAQ